MNKQALLAAENRFLHQYPDGFEHEEMQRIRKRFRVDRHAAYAAEQFATERFDNPADVVQGLAGLASRSGMVSMFEKARLKDAVAELTPTGHGQWADALYELLHGEQQAGFESLLAHLAKVNLAKWTLVTLAPAYCSLQKEVFVKPSTTKLIVKELALDLTYKPTPSWAFYRDYRKALMQMRRLARRVKAPNNPAFTGFLMVALSDPAGR